jgi:hypothetical protein
MRALDDNKDGELAGPELRDLAVWRDADGDGVSDAGEVQSLAAHGIRALSYRHHEIDDAHFAAVAPAGVRLSSGETRPTYDVILRSRTQP